MKYNWGEWKIKEQFSLLYKAIQNMIFSKLLNTVFFKYKTCGRRSTLVCNRNCSFFKTSNKFVIRKHFYKFLKSKYNNFGSIFLPVDFTNIRNIKLQYTNMRPRCWDCTPSICPAARPTRPRSPSSSPPSCWSGAASHPAASFRTSRATYQSSRYTNLSFTKAIT